MSAAPVDPIRFAVGAKAVDGAPSGPDVGFDDCTRVVKFAASDLVVQARPYRPANILATREGSRRLLDFGIAKLCRDKTTGSGRN